MMLVRLREILRKELLLDKTTTTGIGGTDCKAREDDDVKTEQIIEELQLDHGVPVKEYQIYTNT
jgi:hypothetical protein